MKEKIADELLELMQDDDEFLSWSCLRTQVQDAFPWMFDVRDKIDEIFEAKGRKERITKLKEIVALTDDKIFLKFLIEFIILHFGEIPSGKMKGVLSDAKSKERKLKEDMEVHKNDIS